MALTYGDARAAVENRKSVRQEAHPDAELLEAARVLVGRENQIKALLGAVEEFLTGTATKEQLAEVVRQVKIVAGGLDGCRT